MQREHLESFFLAPLFIHHPLPQALEILALYKNKGKKRKRSENIKKSSKELKVEDKGSDTDLRCWREGDINPPLGTFLICGLAGGLRN